MKKAIQLFIFFVLVSANLAWSSPKEITLNYQASRNGKPFANVVETFRQTGEQYQLESITEGVGLAALFGKRVLRSEGVVSANGLQPKHFEQHQGDNEKRSVYADFDWDANRLNLKNKGHVMSEPLMKGTQDLLSFLYQWMFSPPAADEINWPVTTGKKLRVYHYKVLGQNEDMTVEAGQFKVVHLINAGNDEKGGEKEFWLAKDRFYLPIKIIQRDEAGNVIEQTLTSIQVSEE